MFKYASLLTVFLLLPQLAAASELAQVSIKKYEFIPPTITVSKGTVVRWTNNEKRQYHSVWFEESGDPEPDYFFPDETYERGFDEVGRFPYRCGPHPEMIGEVIVTE